MHGNRKNVLVNEGSGFDPGFNMTLKGFGTSIQGAIPFLQMGAIKKSKYSYIYIYMYTLHIYILDIRYKIHTYIYMHMYVPLHQH